MMEENLEKNSLAKTKPDTASSRNDSIEEAQGANASSATKPCKNKNKARFWSQHASSTAIWRDGG